jgi:hypothetical protein
MRTLVKKELLPEGSDHACHIPREMDSDLGIHPSLADPLVRKLYHQGMYIQTRAHSLAYQLVTGETASQYLWPSSFPMAMPEKEPIEKVSHTESTYAEQTLFVQAAIALRYEYSPELLQIMLSMQNRVARSIRCALEKGNLSDALINSIMVLAFQPPTSLPNSKLAHSVFRSPAKHTKSWHESSWIPSWNEEHYAMLCHTIRARGGITTITTPGLAENLQVVDNSKVSFTVDRPNFDMCASFRFTLENIMAGLRPRSVEVEGFQVDEHCKEVLLDVLLCCRVIDEIWDAPIKRHKLDDESGMLTQVRRIVQHRLLSLPRGRSDLEICRLAALIFGYGVIYTCPDPRPMRRLAGQLKNALMETQFTQDQDLEFLFWAAMIGGMGAANGEPDDSPEEFFINELRALSMELGIKNWKEAKALLERFIWLGKACDQGGELLWEMSET